MIEKLLATGGNHVHLVENGTQAVEAVRSGQFDVVLMDVQMPEMDGLQATREIRRWEAGSSRIPIIALTAHAMADDEHRCLEAGMDGYLAKPIDAAALRKALSRIGECVST